MVSRVCQAPVHKQGKQDLKGLWAQLVSHRDRSQGDRSVAWRPPTLLCNHHQTLPWERCPLNSSLPVSLGHHFSVFCFAYTPPISRTMSHWPFCYSLKSFKVYSCHNLCHLPAFWRLTNTALHAYAAFCLGTQLSMDSCLFLLFTIAAVQKRPQNTYMTLRCFLIFFFET